MFRRFHQPIYRFCAAMVGAEEAKDMLQNVMTKAMTSMPDNEDFQMKPWLYRVARNECLDQVRRERRIESGLEADQHAAASDPHDPQNAMLRRERLGQLITDLNDLPEKQRVALVMRELSGLRYEEIAEALDTSPAAGKQLVYEARLSLQQADLGRNLDCSEVRASISSMDRRRLRSRKMRAHMRTCRECADFERAIGSRKESYQMFPLLPVGAAAGILGAVRDGATMVGVGAAAGGAGAAAGGAGGIAAGGAASGLVTKGVVALVVVGGLGVGTANVVHHQREGSGSAGRTAAPGRVELGETGADRSLSARPAAAGVDPRALSPGRARISGDGHRSSRRPSPTANGHQGSGAPSEAGPPGQDRRSPTATPGSGSGNGPSGSNRGQTRAAEASGTVPGQTGSPPPSQKPASPPGQSRPSPGQTKSTSSGTTSSNSGKSAAAPAVGRSASPGKSEK